MSKNVSKGWPSACNVLRPTMLLYVALKCCDRLTGFTCHRKMQNRRSQPRDSYIYGIMARMLEIYIDKTQDIQLNRIFKKNQGLSLQLILGKTFHLFKRFKCVCNSEANITSPSVRAKIVPIFR